MTGARPLIFGELLFDRFPDGRVVLGGAPLNVAWHLAAFGADPLLVTRVGDDALGRQAVRALEAWGLDLGAVQRDPDLPTGTVDVHLDATGPSFEIANGVAFDAIDAASLPEVRDAALVYHGSLALRAPRSARAFDALIERVAAPRFLDVNLRTPWWRLDEVLARLREARWAKLNEDEARQLGVADSAPVETLGLDLLLVTAGERGVEARLAGGTREHVAAPTDVPVEDTVGAGDAFTSVVLLGLLREWPLPLTLRRATAFASRLVGVRGALLHERATYEALVDDWGLDDEHAPAPGATSDD